MALAKRREDVGHRLKLFESGDEERRSSGAGVQLQASTISSLIAVFVVLERETTDSHFVAGRATASNSTA
jgi:hypothetical protein